MSAVAFFSAMVFAWGGCEIIARLLPIEGPIERRMQRHGLQMMGRLVWTAGLLVVLLVPIKFPPLVTVLGGLSGWLLAVVQEVARERRNMKERERAAE